MIFLWIKSISNVNSYFWKQMSTSFSYLEMTFCNLAGKKMFHDFLLTLSILKDFFLINADVITIKIH